jgi:hypothetical protein
MAFSGLEASDQIRLRFQTAWLAREHSSWGWSGARTAALTARRLNSGSMMGGTIAPDNSRTLGVPPSGGQAEVAPLGG